MRNKSNVFICLLLINYFILIINFNCSYRKFRDPQITDKIIALKKGDLVSIVLTDDTQINGIFLKQKKWKIIIGKLENGVMKQESIKINSIYKIQKAGEKKDRGPNAFITIGLLLFVIGLLGYVSFLAGLGEFN